ncbi:MAG: hypothetical protein H0X66_15455 [Verrucomicrobia bacterium]|nr:hypothetical protein [Verrucomicrobiota bacterium]
MGDSEYGLFGTLLGLMNLMTIPTLGLQTIFAQQTASAVTPLDKERLTSTVQTILLWAFILWLMIVLGVLLFQRQIMTDLTINNPAALWMTLAVGLGQLWMPILLGILQGQQNFLWLGLGYLVNGGGRFVAVAIIVGILGWKAAGAVFGAWLGIFGALLIGIVQSRSIWLTARPKCGFQWKIWLKKIMPLTLGLGASQFIFSIDVIFVRSLFGENGTGYYAGAGMIGRGLVMFTAPLTMVMFPKIVHNLSHGRKSNLLVQTLGASFLLGAIAAAGCTIAALGLQYLATTTAEISYVPQAIMEKLKAAKDGVTILSSLIPWFAWAMLPLALANVLLSNLLARQRYQVVLYLVAIALVYALVLLGFGRSFVGVVQILGSFNLLFFSVLALFTWLDTKKESMAPVQ